MPLSDEQPWLIAPSGPLRTEHFFAGLEVMNTLGIHPGWDEGIFASEGHLAGSDAHRAGGLTTGLAHKPRALWMARGGYGAIRTLHESGPALFQGPAVPLWGFSDGTALLSAWDQAGWPAWHAPPPTQFTRLDEESLLRVRAAWHAGHVAPFRELTPLTDGEAEGVLGGGNLCVLTSLVGTPWAADLAGKIVILEDTGEPCYKVDRLFTQLRLSGSLDGIAGLVLGDFSAIPREERPLIESFWRNTAPSMGVPVVTGFPTGHDHRNAPLPFGRATGYIASLHSDTGSHEATLRVKRHP